MRCTEFSSPRTQWPQDTTDPDRVEGRFASVKSSECIHTGYDSVRDLVQAFGYTAHIQARGEEAQAIKRQAGFKARRWGVERTHRWMNRFRRLLTRWEKKAENYLGLLHLVCAVITYRCSGLFG